MSIGVVRHIYFCKFTDVVFVSVETNNFPLSFTSEKTQKMDRRKFIKNSGYTTGMMAVAPAVIKDFVDKSPNDTLNVAVVGISGKRPQVRGMIGGRGMVHIRNYAEIPNVKVTAICDVDER